MDEVLTVNEHRDGDICTVSPNGEVDMQTMKPLREIVRRLPDEGVRHIVFDFRHVSFLDSAGMSILFAAKKSFGDLGGECYIITKENSFVARSLNTVSIDKVMPHFHEEEDALAAVQHHKAVRSAGQAQPRFSLL